MAELDHLVCVVDDLGTCTRQFAEAGFVAWRSPSGGAVQVPLAHCRLELRSTPWGRRLLRRWRRHSGSEHEPGTVVPVLRVDDLEEAVAALRSAGFAVHDPVDRERSAPGGERSRWRQADCDDPDVPLVIEYRSAPPDDRHGEREIRRVVVPVHDLDRAARAYRALLPGEGAVWRAGDTVLQLVPRSSVQRATVELTGAPLPDPLVKLGLSVRHRPGDVDPAAERLAQAVRYRTVSYEERDRIDDGQFAQFGQFLERSFPRVHAELELRTAGHSRLYRWAGRADGRPAALLLAHQDVVPVDDEAAWTYPPFEGVIADGYVWGRGTIDDKSRVLATLEAAERALADGWRPRRTVYLAFGHDEEIGGMHGAAKMADLLAAEGVVADFVLDEGGVIGLGLVDGVPVPTAMIMTGEKGFATVRLFTSDVGGHSSMPPRQTAVARVARAVADIQDHPLPLRLTDPVREMVARVAPYIRGPLGKLAGRAASLGKPLAYALALSRESASLVRTTTAPTVIRGGVKPNVLPQTAEAYVNFRILHGDTTESVLEHCRRVVRDKQVGVELAPGEHHSEPSPISSTDSPVFRMLAELATAVVPEAVVTTGLVPGATDARHYHHVARERFNFAPILVDSADLSGIHGTDERLSLANYARLIDFTGRLLRRL